MGQVTLITGASSGIGRDLAIRLASRGAKLALVGRDPVRLRAVAAQCSSDDVACHAADLGVSGEPQRVVDETLSTFGRIDTLVVNAGQYLGGEVDGTEGTAIESLLATNVAGSIQLVRAALPSMRALGRADIVVVTSVAGYQDIHWEPVYSASKHAMVSFVHTLRRQLVGTGIRVMSIGPGVVLTELWGYGPDDPRQGAEIAAGRGIEVSQVTDTICFMLDRPPHVTLRDVVLLPTNQEI